MTIALDNASSTRQLVTGASSLSYSFTRATGAGGVFVSAEITSGLTITGVTLGGQAMTAIVSAATAANNRLYLFRLINPSTSGAQTVVVTGSGSVGSGYILATTISFTGSIDTAVNFNAASAASATALSNSLSVADQSWCVLAGAGDATDVTAGTGTTAATSANPLTGRNGARTGAGTTTMAITVGAADFLASIICEVKELATAATNYTLTGPTSGTCNVASTNFTVTPNGTSAATVIPSDGGGGGAFAPSTATFDGTATAKTFSYTPASPGVKTISATNSGTLTNPASLTYTALRYSLTDTTSPDGTAVRVLTPWDYSAAAGAHLIVYHHGAGETSTALLADTLKAGCVDALLAAGYVLAGTTALSDNWGKQAGMDTYNSLYAWCVENRRVKKVLFWSQSMGGCTGLLCLSDQRYAVAGWYGTYPVCSLSNMFGANAGTYAPNIRAAFGIAADGSDYAAKTTGHDPLLVAAANYPPVPLRFVASAGDTVVTKTANTDAFITAIAARVPESSLVVATGNHGDPSHFLPSDMTTAMARFVAYVPRGRVVTIG